MKLSEYAKKQGITYLTANRWYHKGLITGAYQTATGTIIVPDKTMTDRTKTIIYARVSSNEQRKTDLETQAQRMKDFCLANGWTVDEVVKEVGSGLNDNRRRLEKVLKDPHLGRLVVEHRDRLTRFGFHWFEVLAGLQGFEIVVADKTIDNDKNDLMADFTAIITSFCARLYSRRRADHKKKVIEDIIRQDS